MSSTETKIQISPNIEVKSSKIIDEQKIDREVKDEVLNSDFIYKLVYNFNITDSWWKMSICTSRVILMVIAFILAWRCNSSINFLFRIFIALLASLFSEIYVVYFFLYRTVLGYKCN